MFKKLSFFNKKNFAILISVSCILLLSVTNMNDEKEIIYNGIQRLTESLRIFIIKNAIHTKININITCVKIKCIYFNAIFSFIISNSLNSDCVGGKSNRPLPGRLMYQQLPVYHITRPGLCKLHVASRRIHRVTHRRINLKFMRRLFNILFNMKF